MQSNTCQCWAANHPCTSGFPSEIFCNRGPKRSPTAPRLTTNVSKNNKEDQEAAPNLCQAIPQAAFHSDAPSFSPRVLTRGYKWPALQARADTAYVPPAIKDTSAPDPATPEAVGSSKINSNRAKPKDGQTAPPSTPAGPDSDATLAGVTETHIISSQPRTHPRARPTRQNSRGTPENWGRYTRYRKERSTPLPDQR